MMLKNIGLVCSFVSAAVLLWMVLTMPNDAPKLVKEIFHIFLLGGGVALSLAGVVCGYISLRKLEKDIMVFVGLLAGAIGLGGWSFFFVISLLMLQKP